MNAPNIYVSEARPGYWLASVPAVMGCSASGASRDEAIANVREAFVAYREMLASRGAATEHWKDLDPRAFAVADAPGPLLPEDQLPIEEHELRDFLHLFEAQQAALMALAATVDAASIERARDEDTWSVREALEHLVQTQITQLSRLEKWPDDPFNTVQAVHRLVAQRFTVLDPSATTGVKVIGGRPWTVRRVMRRILEHEWEHYQQIKEIIDALGRSPRA